MVHIRRQTPDIRGAEAQKNVLATEYPEEKTLAFEGECRRVNDRGEEAYQKVIDVSGTPG